MGCGRFFLLSFWSNCTLTQNQKNCQGEAIMLRHHTHIRTPNHPARIKVMLVMYLLSVSVPQSLASPTTFSLHFRILVKAWVC